MLRIGRKSLGTHHSRGVRVGITTVQTVGQVGVRTSQWQTENPQEEGSSGTGSQDCCDRMGAAARQERLGTQTNDRNHRVVWQDACCTEADAREHEAQGEQRPAQEPPSS